MNKKDIYNFVVKNISSLLDRTGVDYKVKRIKLFGEREKEIITSKVDLLGVEFQFKCTFAVIVKGKISCKLFIKPMIEGYSFETELTLIIAVASSGRKEFDRAEDFGKLNTALQHSIAYAHGLVQMQLHHE